MVAPDGGSIPGCPTPFSFRPGFHGSPARKRKRSCRQAARPRQREVSFRTLNVRHWDRIVEAWAEDDDQALDDARISDAAVDLGSQWGQYEYVTNIGFAA